MKDNNKKVLILMVLIALFVFFILTVTYVYGYQIVIPENAYENMSIKHCQKLFVNESDFYECLDFYNEVMNYLIKVTNHSKIINNTIYNKTIINNYTETLIYINKTIILNNTIVLDTSKEKELDHEYRMKMIDQGVVLDKDDNPINVEQPEVDLSNFYNKGEIDTIISKEISNNAPPLSLETQEQQKPAVFFNDVIDVVVLLFGVVAVGFLVYRRFIKRRLNKNNQYVPSENAKKEMEWENVDES